MSDDRGMEAVKAVIKTTPEPILIGLASLIFAVGLTVAAAVSLDCGSFEEGKWWQFSFHDHCSLGTFTLNRVTTVLILYLVAVLVCICVLFLTNKIASNKNNDGLTKIRNKIKGHWQVKATTTDGTEWEGDAHFTIDRKLRKLFLSVDAPARSIYKEHIINTWDISLNPREDPMKITYFVEDSFPLVDGRCITRLVVARLKWVFSPQDGQEYLQGTWYDLAPVETATQTSGPVLFSRRWRH
jgi:hypothetical protein